MSDAAKFWDKVAISGVPGDCWLWKGARCGRRGEKYGQVKWNGRNVYAHRIAWELDHDSLIPFGLVIDHTCRTHLCVNPDHLRVTTQRENILSGTGVAARLVRGDYVARDANGRIAAREPSA